MLATPPRPRQNVEAIEGNGLAGALAHSEVLRSSVETLQGSVNLPQLFRLAGGIRRFKLLVRRVGPNVGQVQTGPQRDEDGNIVPGRSFALKDFKTSTGAEIRFFMPVLNVPFRLIFAYNPQRHGVLDNRLQPQKAFQFRFAVGTTF